MDESTNADGANPDESSASDLTTDEPTIRLDHFLQACGVPTGGQAKQLVQAGQILVNDQVETRRRKKLRAGDEVTLDGEVFVVASE